VGERTGRPTDLHSVTLCETVPTRRYNKKLAAGFGRHGMPPPTSNDTGTALGQHGSDWSRRVFATLTFNLEVMVPVADAGRRPPSVYQVWSSQALPFGRYGSRCVSTLMDPGNSDLWPFDLETSMWDASKVGGPSFQIWAR